MWPASTPACRKAQSESREDHLPPAFSGSHSRSLRKYQAVRPVRTSYFTVLQMAKRRAKPDPDRRNRSEPAPRGVQAIDAATHTRISFFFFFLFLILPIVSVLIYRFIYPLTDTHTDTSTVLSVYERGLVKRDTSYQEILAENFRASVNITHRHFPNLVLAYVTPWNSKGYDMAKRFTSKFTHISPVWYELKRFYLELLLKHFPVSFLERRSNGNRQSISL